MIEENLESVRLATDALQAHERLHLHLKQSHRHTNGTKFDHCDFVWKVYLTHLYITLKCSDYLKSSILL